MEVVCALAFAAVALGSCARQFGGSALTVTGLLPLPFALVALFGIWMSRMPAARKILWSVAPVAFTLPFLPIG